jgi:microcystin-dependent protein
MSTPFVGEIRIFGFNYAPDGWALCNGQTLSTTQNEVLFLLIGYTYGGTGTSFQLPNLQGRVPIHQGTGVSSYVYGQSGGAESITLSSGQMPAHTHLINANSGSATSSRPGGAVLARGSGEVYAAAADGTTTLNSDSVSSAGGATPVDLRQPYLTLNFCIALAGIYPSQG